MTDTKNQNQNQEDQALLSLQEELDRMAAETPEMPESFRQGWREAIRKEAAAGEEKKIETGNQREIPEPNLTEIKPTRRLSAKWRRGLSIAAVAAFILGGTLLGQDQISLTQTAQTNEVMAAQDAKDDAAEEEGTAAEASGAVFSAKLTSRDAEVEEAAEEAFEEETTEEETTEEEVQMDTADTDGGEIKAEAATESGTTAAEQGQQTGPLQVLGEVLIGLSLLCLVILFTFRK